MIFQVLNPIWITSTSLAWQNYRLLAKNSVDITIAQSSFLGLYDLWPISKPIVYFWKVFFHAFARGNDLLFNLKSLFHSFTEESDFFFLFWTKQEDKDVSIFESKKLIIGSRSHYYSPTRSRQTTHANFLTPSPKSPQMADFYFFVFDLFEKFSAFPSTHTHTHTITSRFKL